MPAFIPPVKHVSSAPSCERFAGVAAETSCQCRLLGANPAVGDQACEEFPLISVSFISRQYGQSLGATPLKFCGVIVGIFATWHAFTLNFGSGSPFRHFIQTTTKFSMGGFASRIPVIQPTSLSPPRPPVRDSVLEWGPLCFLDPKITFIHNPINV